MKNKKTLYHFVLDKSGSMSNCRETTVNGFNSQLDTIKDLQNAVKQNKIQLSEQQLEKNNLDRLIKDRSDTHTVLDLINKANADLKSKF